MCQISPVRSCAATGLPDQRNGTVDDVVDRLELLVARDLLDRLALLRLEDNEVLQEVEQDARASAAADP